MSFDDALVSAYVRRGLLSVHQQPVHLPTACPKRSECWKGAEHRAPAVGAVASQFTAPWIGPLYREGGLLVLLMNLNEYGGWDLRPEAEVGMRYLGRCARAGFAKGHRRLFGGGGYRGTMVWVQAVSYAAVWLGRVSELAVAWNGDRVAGASLGEAMDRIVIAQHVKCSPLGEASAPTPEMWKTCGAHVLREELAILRPRRIIVVGTGWSHSALREFVIPGAAREATTRSLKSSSKTFTLTLEKEVSFGDQLIDFLVVPHPAAPGGASRGLMREAHALLGSS